jgi:hypothetical protein
LGKKPKEKDSSKGTSALWQKYRDKKRALKVFRTIGQAHESEKE